MKNSIIALLVASSVAFAAPATLATVNGKAITITDANTFLSKAAPGASYDKLDANMKKQVVEQLVNQTLVKEEVTRAGIYNSSEFKTKYAALKEDLAVDIWMKQQMDKIKVTDKETKEFYDANSDKMMNGDKKVSYADAKNEITQFVKFEKFKAAMDKTASDLRAKAKVVIK